jgi:hypothetical protein
MMRLNVDRPDAGRIHSIPKDNPFVSTPGTLPRFGLMASAIRGAFDPQTGQPWVGDVGQDIWEMIELSHKGANHGWSVMEEYHLFQPRRERGPTPIVAPGVMPYSINAPFWSDGASKERFFALPGRAAIDFKPDEPWQWDDGAANLKSFCIGVRGWQSRVQKVH